MSSKTTERLGRFLAAEADYLNDAGWQPHVPEPGVVRWTNPPNYLAHYRQIDAVSLQRAADARETGAEDT